MPSLSGTLKRRSPPGGNIPPACFIRLSSSPRFARFCSRCDQAAHNPTTSTATGDRLTAPSSPVMRGTSRTRDGRIAQGAHDRSSVGSGDHWTEPDQCITFDLGVLGLFLLNQVGLVEDFDSVGDVGSVLSSEDDLRGRAKGQFSITALTSQRHAFRVRSTLTVL